MKLHPLHMMFVHFPAALLPMDLIFWCAAKFFDNETISLAGYYCLMGGVIGGWAAIVTGLFDLFNYLLIPGSAAIKKGIFHGSIQSIMVFGFTVVLAIEYNNPVYVYNAPTGLWIGKIILIVMLLSGNYLGGDLMLRYVSKQFKPDSA